MTLIPKCTDWIISWRQGMSPQNQKGINVHKSEKNTLMSAYAYGVYEMALCPRLTCIIKIRFLITPFPFSGNAVPDPDSMLVLRLT